MAFEYKLTALRETAPEVFQCDTPERAAQYWREHIATAPAFNPDVEGLYVLLLNTRRNVKGHVLISTGTLDTLLVHPRETYRAAIVGAASAIVLMHSHPSGDPSPSEADIRATRDLIRAGQLLKMELLDHVIVGRASEHQPRNHCSLRELGYFAG